MSEFFIFCDKPRCKVSSILTKTSFVISWIDKNMFIALKAWLFSWPREKLTFKLNMWTSDDLLYDELLCIKLSNDSQSSTVLKCNANMNVAPIWVQNYEYWKELLTTQWVLLIFIVYVCADYACILLYKWLFRGRSGENLMTSGICFRKLMPMTFIMKGWLFFSGTGTAQIRVQIQTQ